MGVKVQRFFVQRMKTKWGSCSRHSATIRLNTDLAKKPRECLEYIVVHEMAHLLEPTHNSHFTDLMDQFMPGWRFYREMLNRFAGTPRELAILIGFVFLGGHQTVFVIAPRAPRGSSNPLAVRTRRI